MALSRNISPDAAQRYNLENEVLLYSKTTNYWISLHDVVDVDKRMITVIQRNERLRKTFKFFR